MFDCRIHAIIFPRSQNVGKSISSLNKGAISVDRRVKTFGQTHRAVFPLMKLTH